MKVPRWRSLANATISGERGFLYARRNVRAVDGPQVKGSDRAAFVRGMTQYAVPGMRSRSLDERQILQRLWSSAAPRLCRLWPALCRRQSLL